MKFLSKVGHNLPSDIMRLKVEDGRWFKAFKVRQDQ
jgi:hypothetical protein